MCVGKEAFAGWSTNEGKSKGGKRKTRPKKEELKIRMQERRKRRDYAARE
jgi:hypothetical protein